MNNLRHAWNGRVRQRDGARQTTCGHWLPSNSTHFAAAGSIDCPACEEKERIETFKLRQRQQKEVQV